MTTAAIRKQLHQYIDIANDKKLKAIFTILEADIDAISETNYNKWDDPKFVIEIERRTAALENGSDKGYSWDEVKKRARLSINDKVKK